MTKREILYELAHDDEIVFLENYYDEALIGYTTENRLVYDYNKMVQALMDAEGYSKQDAMEWIDYNTFSLLREGEAIGPVVMYALPEGDDNDETETD